MPKNRETRPAGKSRGPVRYALVGLGYFGQIAVLPAFAHARRNSRLVALVSDDPVKRRRLGKKYGVELLYSYEQYGQCLASGEIDAVYIALPNHLHRDYTVPACEAGVHVLCEKPMAVTEDECGDMIRAAEYGKVRLMIGYRLHFEEANLKAVEVVKSGRLGEPRIFSSVFTMQVEDPDNIRLNPIEQGGGTLYDIGIYCINAARYLFRAEPIEVSALSANRGDRRFRNVDEMTSAVLRFPGERLAAFTSSFGASSHGSYRIVGTKGDVLVIRRLRVRGLQEDRDHRWKKEDPHELPEARSGRRRAPALLGVRSRGQGARGVRPGGACGRADHPRPLPLGARGTSRDTALLREEPATHARTGSPATAGPAAPARAGKPAVGGLVLGSRRH